MASSADIARERLDKWSTPVTETGCHLWTGAELRGYGVMKVDGRVRRAHRVSWEINRGSIPDGMCACHKCDTPLCINPDHLFLGTRADNAADMMRKGRHRPETTRGELNGSSRLTTEQVLAIRGAKGLHRDIALHHGISFETVGDIKTRRRWGHVA